MTTTQFSFRIWRAFASGPAGEIPPGESIVKRCWRPDLRSKCHLPCSAEKLGDLGDPGFQARLFWKRLWGFFLVTTRLRVVNISANDGSSFLVYQGRNGKRSN